MSLVDHDHVVDAVPADGTDHSFDVGILPRGAVRGDDLFDSHGLNTQPELGAINAVSMSGLAEEAGFAYKNISQVVEAVERAGITKKVAELRPIGNIKG